jgi:dihydrofolate reductase
MKVTLFMASSLKGMIARPDNTEDFLSYEGWDYYIDLTSKAGSTIWGRKTYDIIHANTKEYSAEEIAKLNQVQKIILTSNAELPLKEGYQKASSPRETLELLSNQGFTETIICGGSKLNTSFAKAGLIDEIILYLEPVGVGIPLFSIDNFDLELKLIEVTKTTRGGIFVKYQVIS